MAAEPSAQVAPPEKTESILDVAKEPYPLDPGALYFESMKGRRVRLAVGRDRVEGLLVHVAYRAEAFAVVSLDRAQIEYGKSWRLEDLTWVPASAVRGVTLLEDQVHREEVERRVT